MSKFYPYNLAHYVLFGYDLIPPSNNLYNLEPK